MTVALPRHRFTADQFDHMVEQGIVEPDARIELLDGEVLDMTPIGRRHARLQLALATLLHREVEGRALVGTQHPLRLGEHSEVYPDLVLLAPRDDFYPEIPTAADALLVIEIADTSLPRDRQVKLPLYARAAVPEVWIVDVASEAVEVFSEPARDRYATLRRYEKTDGPLEPSALPGIAIPIGKLFR